MGRSYMISIPLSKNKKYHRHSLWTVASTNFICVSLCVSVCLSSFMAYILLTMGQILIKLGENVGTLVQLVVLKFHKNRFSFDEL